MHLLFLVGVMLLCGLAGSLLIRLFKLPQVIGQILIGLVVGASGLNLISPKMMTQFGDISSFALGTIGLMIGGELRWARIKRFGVSILTITLFETLCSTLAVFLALYLITGNLPLALIMGALASATAPGGTTNIIQEYRTRGSLTSTLLGVVGADDAVAIVIYAFAFNLSKVFLVAQATVTPLQIAWAAMSEIGLSILLGTILGIGLVSLMKHIKGDDVKQIVMVGLVLMCSGIALTFQLSLILSNMTLGIVISNLRPHQSRPFFLSIIQLSPAIYILFFVLVGARLQASLLPAMGIIGVVYIIFRIFGKMSGAWMGGRLSGAPPQVRSNLGMCLLSQAGVAIGLAISTQAELQHLSDSAQEIGLIVINVITATTFIFQIIGPVATKLGFERAGEIRRP